MNKDRIKALFFDLDHTLWDFETNSELALRKLFQTYQLKLPFDAFLEVYVPNNFLYWKLYREGKIDQQTLRFERLKTTFDKLNYTATDALIDTLSDAYVRTLPEYNVLFEGALDILNVLKERFSLHVITNGFKEVQYLKMKNSGLLPFFETITDSSSVGRKKPDPSIFNHALKTANVIANASVMIGDNLEADIDGALSVGMHAIHFMPLEKKQPLHYKEIEKLSELEFLR